MVGISCIANAVKTKNKVYVHCKNGHGRAPTLVAAYLITQGMSVKEAVAFLEAKRAGVDIQPVQLEALKQYEKLFKKITPLGVIDRGKK